MKNQPIGIFDSGLGGLTVVSKIMELLPNEDLVYFGDTARVPYGSKSKEVVVEFSLQIASFLLKKNVKMIVVACNTASAHALGALKKRLHVPVLGVIEPGARAAVENTRNGRIGIIGTEGTVKSSSYVKAINSAGKGNKSFQRSCPLFVPLVEEGWLDKKITNDVAKEYLKPLLKEKIDTLILGCTHYPLIKKAIKKTAGSKVALIDSASATAKETAEILKQKDLKSTRKTKGKCRFYVSDSPEKFRSIGQRFLGKSPMKVAKVALH